MSTATAETKTQSVRNQAFILLLKKLYAALVEYVETVPPTDQRIDLQEHQDEPGHLSER